MSEQNADYAPDKGEPNMSTTYDLPLPGDALFDSTVIASVYAGEDDRGGLLLLLNKAKPFYSVLEVADLRDMEPIHDETFENINSAVAYFADNGGDH